MRREFGPELFAEVALRNTGGMEPLRFHYPGIDLSSPDIARPSSLASDLVTASTAALCTINGVSEGEGGRARTDVDDAAPVRQNA